MKFNLTTLLFWRHLRPAVQRRLWRLTAAVAGIAIAGALTLYGLRDSFLYFYTPSDYAALQHKPSGRFRLGGLVQKGSLQKTAATITFIVADMTDNTMTVRYNGTPPDLFREGQGVIADGRLVDTIFVADYLLAKHDEVYMPPQVASSLRAQGHVPAKSAP